MTALTPAAPSSSEDPCAACGKPRREHRPGYSAYRCTFRDAAAPDGDLRERAIAGEHPVTVEWDGGLVTYRMACNAPADALCHAVYECDCESYYSPGVIGDHPAHLTEAGHVHQGKFDAAFCNLREWFDVEPVEVLHGSLTFPVVASWNGDGYEFEVATLPAPVVSVSARYVPDAVDAIHDAYDGDPDSDQGFARAVLADVIAALGITVADTPEAGERA